MRKSLLFRFWDKFDRPKEGCWNWKALKDRDGYGLIARCSYGAYFSRIPAHRLSWMLYNGPIFNGLCVLHKCDNPSCVNPKHLFLGTKGDNAKDRDVKGRLVVRCGEQHVNSKLTEVKVKQIRQLRQQGIKAIDIAKKFNISPCHVCNIVKGLWWKHV